MSLSFTKITIRNLGAQRVRTLLGSGIVALGVGTVIGVNIASAAILNSLSSSPDAQAFIGGLLDQFDQLLMGIGLMITLVTGFLMFNSFFLSVTQRRRQIGALRLLGVTQRQVLRMVFAEAVLIGTFGALLGILVGPLFGKGSISLIEAALGEGIFTFQDSLATFEDLLIPAGLGLGVTLLAVLLPARRAASLHPLEALRVHSPERISPDSRFPARLGLILGLLLLITLAVLRLSGLPRPPWDGLAPVLAEGLWLTALGVSLPAVIGVFGRLIGKLLGQALPGVGRLIADNFRRERLRVTLVVSSFALGLALVCALTGFIRFAWEELFGPRVQGVMKLQAWMVTPFDIEAGMAAYSQMENLRLSPEVTEVVKDAVGDRGRVMEWHFIVVPELSFLGETYFSFLADPASLQLAGDAFFAFIDGDWGFAGPIMRSGCGVLIAPLIAERNKLSLGDSFSVTGLDGPVTCRVAGIGSPYVGASLISMAAGPAFGVVPHEIQPIVLLVWPLPGADRVLLAEDLDSALKAYPSVQFSSLAALTALQEQVMESLPVMISGLSFLAVLAAALGVLNTTMLSLFERQRELTLLHTLGATLGQVRYLVIGEAALIGFVGAGYGIIAGVGGLLIFIMTFSGRSWGIPNLDVWGAAVRAAPPALVTGLIGLAVSPVMSAAGAWIVWRGLFRPGRKAELGPCLLITPAFLFPPGWMAAGAVLEIANPFLAMLRLDLTRIVFVTPIAGIPGQCGGVAGLAG